MGVESDLVYLLRDTKLSFLVLDVVYIVQLCLNSLIVYPKVNIHSNIQSFSYSLEVHVFVLLRFPDRDIASSASWPCLNFQHYDCIACWEIARIFDRVSFLPALFSHSATPIYYGNFALVVIFSGDKFQTMPWQAKTLISSRVPRRLRFGAAIFPFQRATRQIHKTKYITLLASLRRRTRGYSHA